MTPLRRGQFFKSRLELSAEVGRRRTRPWRYCPTCGEHVKAGRAHTCHRCRAWAHRIMARHAWARIRRLFAE